MKDSKIEYSNLKDFYIESNLDDLNLSGSVDMHIHVKYRLWLISDSEKVKNIPSKPEIVLLLFLLRVINQLSICVSSVACLRLGKDNTANFDF